MAACHVRSISLPSRSHPITVSIQGQLYKLKASQYSSIDDLLQLTMTQQNLSDEFVENALNGSLKLLDICDSTRDFFSKMKECVQELEFSLCRRKGEHSDLANEVDAHMLSRKKLNKKISKSLRNLKIKDWNCTTEGLNNNSDPIIMLRGVEQISVVVFESILSFISQPKVKSKSSGRSIISKLLQSKHVSSEAEVEVNEVEKIDVELLILKSSKDIKLLQLQNVVKGLEALESSIQEVEEELMCIYRRLVKTRVSLLNILNH